MDLVVVRARARSRQGDSEHTSVGRVIDDHVVAASKKDYCIVDVVADEVVASRLMWKIERRSSGIPSIASRDRHRLESRRGGYESIAALAIVALRGSERSRFSRPWTRSARAQLDGVTPRAAAAC